ncbi:unnamed protein product [Medioppia subpectinata]|uniref:Uncharacterized protein n=1 Tax=Medioppia subpectinata TaxID=1979941 RepID=A0A7R9PUD9_9ACAR|nr:unnamed protein product [Medioppia subpectinata]CAG2101105.1 unnamed protein product [Medioppia subpectinata]
MIIAGVTSVLVGALVTIVDTLFPNKFSTILEVDYDTPYRYFVGNDAHLIGAPIPNGHNCPHNTLSNTSSGATDSTACCGGRAVNSQGTGRVVTIVHKTKSDASTSTAADRMGGAVETNGGQTTVTTTAHIETDDGFTNSAFERGEGEDDGDSDVSTTIIDGKRAISLHNFGKYAAQQQQRGQKTNSITLRHKNFDLYY